MDIWCHIAIESPAAADRVLDRLAKRINLLRDYPELGASRPEIADEARILVEGNYLILYRIAGESIDIIRIVHGARDVANLD